MCVSVCERKSVSWMRMCVRERKKVCGIVWVWHINCTVADFLLHTYNAEICKPKLFFCNTIRIDIFGLFCLYSDRTVKVWTGNEMERRGGEWDREMTAGRMRTRVPV